MQPLLPVVVMAPPGENLMNTLVVMLILFPVKEKEVSSS